MGLDDVRGRLTHEKRSPFLRHLVPCFSRPTQILPFVFKLHNRLLSLSPHTLFSLLLLCGTAIEVDGDVARTALFEASTMDHATVGGHLLFQGTVGSNVLSKSAIVEGGGAYGERALCTASDRGYADVVRVLLNEGKANVMRQDTMGRLPSLSHVTTFESQPWRSHSKLMGSI